jgi:predicted RNA-binding Zn ribbon-like protein
MPSRSPAAGQAIGQAPGGLGLVQAFVNTRDIELATDELASTAGLAAWPARSGLLSTAGADGAGQPDMTSPAGRPADVSEQDLDLAVRLREALRGVLRAHAGHGSARAAAADLGAIATGLRAQIVVGADGRVRSAPAGLGAPAALARLLLVAAEAGTAGTWARLKACTADDCQWAFYDRSPTRNGCWCSMQICGARAKSRAYRSRAAASR